MPSLVIFNFDPSFSSPQIWMISLGSKCEVSEIPVDQVHFTILQKARSSMGLALNLVLVGTLMVKREVTT